MKIKKIPKFWIEKNNILFILFLPFSIIYLIVLKINSYMQKLTQKDFKIKIICVGNIFLGGTGKTPLVKKIYNDLKKKDKCCILKKFSKNHLDEINFLKKNSILFAPNKRVDGLNDAESKGYKTAIIDDGMQDYSFKKNVSILCVKSKYAFGNEYLLPAGPLREPLKKINNYDIAVVNGENNEKINYTLKKNNPRIKIFYSTYMINNIDTLKGKNFLAFSGIADNQDFFDILNKNNISVIITEKFSDHHNFTENEIQKLQKKADEKKIELITTEKNYNNIPEIFKDKIHYASLDLKINNYKELLNEIG